MAKVHQAVEHIAREIDARRIEQLTREIDKLDRERRKLVYERMNLRRAQSQLGRVFSPETRAKISAAKAGKPMSEDARQAMSARQRERFKDPKEREKNRAIAIAREIAKKNKRLQDPLETMIFGRG